MKDFFLVMIAIAFLGAVVFLVGYALVDIKTRWYAYPMGRLIASDQLIIALMLGTTLARVAWQIPIWVSMIEFVMLASITWWRVAIWLRTRRTGANERNALVAATTQEGDRRTSDYSTRVVPNGERGQSRHDQ